MWATVRWIFPIFSLSSLPTPKKETQKEIGNPTRSCQLLDQWYENHLNDAAWPASNKSKYVVLIGQMMHMFICFHLLNTPAIVCHHGQYWKLCKTKGYGAALSTQIVLLWWTWLLNVVELSSGVHHNPLKPNNCQYGYFMLCHFKGYIHVSNPIVHYPINQPWLGS